MKISAPEIVDAGDRFRLVSRVAYAGQETSLWFEMDTALRQYATVEKADAFLTALVVLAMRHGEDMEIAAPVSSRLYYGVQNHIVPVLQQMIPSLQRVNIRPQALDDGRDAACAGNVVTGFSGGIDSFCVLADHLDPAVPVTHRVTHLVFNNVGSHGDHRPGPARELFHRRYEELRGYPDEIGMDFIRIDSNLLELLQMNFQLTHTPRNVACIQTLQKLFGRYYYASTYRYRDCRIAAAYDMAYADPVLVPLLSTETLDCVSTGSQYTRVEKTRRVADFEPSRRYLNVCTSPQARGKNCSRCMKCSRTMFTLELLGRTDVFREVFDWSEWPSTRRRFVNRVLGDRGDPFLREIREYADATGYRFALTDRIAGLPYLFGKSLLSLLPEDFEAKIKRLARGR